MNINLHLHPNSSYYCQLSQMCISKRKKKIIIAHIYIYIYVWACINIIRVLFFVFDFFWGGAQITICVYRGGHEKKVGNHCSIGSSNVIIYEGL